MDVFDNHTNSLAAAGWARQVTPALVALPVVCFTALLLAYVVNVPWMDDIEAFLTFILGYLDARTAGDKLDWLLRPNNEHRILTGKLITVALYQLTGEVNFRWLILAAFGFLLGSLGIFYRVFRSIRLPLLAFVPVGFFLLQPQYYLTTMWAITGLQHQVVVAMTLAMIYLLASDTSSRFAGALGLQVLTSLSMSNGLFGWVAGAVVLVQQRQWLRLGGWLVVGAATIVFYFHDFPNGQGNESSINFFLRYPYLTLIGFFTFTGGLFDFFQTHSIVWRSVAPTLAGLVFIPTMVALLWRMNEPLLRFKRTLQASDRVTTALWKRRYFFTGCYAFLMVNALIIAFLRPRFGFGVMLISNYMLYPAVLVVLLYLNVLSEYSRSTLTVNRWVSAGVLVSLIVWGNWYVRYLPKIAYRKEQLLMSAFNQKHNEIGLGPNWGSPFADLVRQAINQTVSRGIYRYPDAYFSPYEPIVRSSKSLSAEPAYDLRVVGTGDIVVAEATADSLSQPAGPVAAVVQSDRHTYLFAAESPFAFMTFYGRRPARQLSAEISKTLLAPGPYRVGALTQVGEGASVRFSRQTVTVPQEMDDHQRPQR